MMYEKLDRKLTSQPMFELVKRQSPRGEFLDWVRAPENLIEVFLTFKKRGDAPFIRYQEKSISYSEFYQSTLELASVLQRRFDIQKGDRVAICMRNSIEWVQCFWASIVAGAVAVPVNSWFRGNELAFVINDSGAKLVFMDPPRIDELHKADQALKQTEIICVGDKAASDCVSFSDLFGKVKSAPEQREITRLDTATILYTSGTTGKPKGAVGTHGNATGIYYSQLYSRARADARAVEENWVFGKPEKGGFGTLLSVPLFHVTGSLALMLTAATSGNVIQLMYKWDAELAVKHIIEDKLATCGGVPTMVWQMLHAKNFDSKKMQHLTTIGYGGAPAAPTLVQKLAEYFPHIQANNGYGATETSSILSVCRGVDYLKKPNSAGYTLPICETKICNAKGEKVTTGEVGELWVRGSNVIKEYWNNPDANAKAFEDDWYKSGDLLSQDEDGFLYVVDRVKDMVIRGGENIYCVEVEDALFSHEHILDAAAYGVDHEILGEELAASVIVHAGSKLTENDIANYLKPLIASFKIPSYIEIRSEQLPRNPNGKVLKSELKKHLTQMLQRKEIQAI